MTGERPQACGCRKELEVKLTEMFQAETPASTGHKVTLQGYAYMLSGDGPSSRPFMEYETFAFVPLKAGGSKPKKAKGNMFLSFCPFCGVKILGDKS